MRRFWWLLLMVILLTGCSGEESYETVSDQLEVPVIAVHYTMDLQLPEEAVNPVMDTGSEKLYECTDYTLILQTLDGGDLSRTFREVTGMEIDSLTILQTQRSGTDCYQCAWTTAGEDAQRICRTLILDDGNMHHAVTVMADHAIAGDLTQQWEKIFRSAALVSTD